MTAVEGHIVLIEDNEATRYAVSRVLRGAGYRVTCAEDGQTGIATVGAAKPDLVLLDVNLPDMSGWDVVRRLKGDPATVAIPVVHLSATYVSAAAQVRGLEGGADAYLTHPVDPHVLIATVKAFLRARRAEAELAAANERLREADRRKDDFLGMLSHELRNPLAPIRSSVYVLRHSPPGSEQARRAEDVIDRQTGHLTRLVDDLLDVTRIARGKIELRRARVDLRDVVRRAAEDFRLPLEEGGVTFRTELADAEVWVEADATRIAQVVGNLLQNAAKFTRAGDAVTLSVRRLEEAAEIAVRDTGAGIGAVLLPRVFEPFVQGDRTLARSEGGLGLGLALVKGIAELHGGSVGAESAGHGNGAEFFVRLPLAPPAAEAAPPDDAAQPRGGRHQVLVVDDNRDAAESLADIVSLLGHPVAVAFDGPAAIEMARANPPDVVLCDLGLPGMSGYEVARVLRAEGTGDLRLVAVSGYAQPGDLRASVEAGFDRHLAKPADPSDIERLLA